MLHLYVNHTLRTSLDSSFIEMTIGKYSYLMYNSFIINPQAIIEMQKLTNQNILLKIHKM